MSAPDLTEKVIGFRAWQLRDRKLWPANDGLPAWNVGVNRAACLGDLFGAAETNHDVPDQECDCGFYGWHDIQAAKGRYFDDESILGAVAAWGSLMMHCDGFRAEYVQPIAFAYDDDYQLGQHRRAGEFAHEHGLRYMPLEELAEFAGSFGSVIPKHMRPPAPETPVKTGSGYLTFSPTAVSKMYFGGNTVKWVVGDSWGDPPNPLLPEEDELLALAGFDHKLDDLHARLTRGVNDDLVRRLGL